ncbi:MAG: hypothetical protein QOI35_1850, partial [Cryptosporangiaceae bacterium]|nr:hypothetical protein [Cryptosporangiaceae bacterium]
MLAADPGFAQVTGERVARLGSVAEYR